MKKPLFVLMQYYLPRHFLSRMIGKLMQNKTPWLKNLIIHWFVKRYNVNLSEAVRETPEEYKTFNDFFIRKLKSSARNIIADNKKIICPVDGSVSQIGKINKTNVIQAKGITYSLQKLLANHSHLVDIFQNGSFATLYLAPKDYHRIHMPCDGELKEMYYVPGQLFSVNEVTAEHVPNLFARNERAVCVFDTTNGPMVVIMVGAMLVASIYTAWSGKITPNRTKSVQVWQYKDSPIHLKQGGELGYFCLGSTVILLFPEKIVDWRSDLMAGSSIKLGQELAGVVVG